MDFERRITGRQVHAKFLLDMLTNHDRRFIKNALPSAPAYQIGNRAAIERGVAVKENPLVKYLRGMK